MSESASKDVDDTDERRSIPFNSDCSIHLIIPEAGARYVESTVSFLHNNAVGNELEVLVDAGDALEDLNQSGGTSSQIWLVQIWASLTL